MKLGSNLDLSKVVRNLGERYKLVPHLDLEISKEEFVWEAKFKPKEADDAWHPSGDCTPSLLDLYLKASDQLEPRPIGPSLRKTFIVGHFWHAYLQWIVEKRLEWASHDAIERSGERVWAHRWDDPNPHVIVSPKPYHWARGSGDVAPINIPGESPMAVDFKTMNGRMFQTGPSPDYRAKWECQGNIYMDFFDLDRILFVGICKDSPHEMKEWVFERNQPLIDAIYMKWRIVSECLDEGVTPPEDEDVPLRLKGPIVT